MEKIVYLKTLQIVLTLALIWQLLSLRQFCGTFADPKAFIHEISIDHCKRFTLIGKDSKSGEFGVVFDHHKWHNRFFMNGTNGQTTKEQKHQYLDELAAKLPSAGRFCIPITISPSDWIGKARNFLDNGTLFYFSHQLLVALCSLGILGLSIIDLLSNVDKSSAYVHALASVACWCFSATLSSRLLLNWSDLWTSVNFRADHTNVPFDTLVLSSVLACSSVFEIFFMNLLLKKHPVNAPTTADAHHHKLRNCVATQCAIE